ncbi:hypothetical protein WG922_17800 [Ramlibacter sp. AN1015]|uniref:hypothetical protein n=1 Tax=Ramlibacter sp. AN1015 TaxID=3133428 RepID=UPI0030BEFB4A
MHSGRRVLVVQDQERAGEALADILTMHGHQVRTCWRLCDLPHQLGSFVPEIIILELAPGPARDACHIIRSDPRTAAAVLLAAADPSACGELRALQLHAVLPSPAPAKPLLRLLETLTPRG